jgi:hypothetical protein
MAESWSNQARNPTSAFDRVLRADYALAWWLPRSRRLLG